MKYRLESPCEPNENGIQRRLRILVFGVLAFAAVVLAIKWYRDQRPVWSYLATFMVVAAATVLGHWLALARAKARQKQQGGRYHLPDEK
jgi:uncharacterized membrane protein YoaK (UPF0700 family)